MDDAPEMGVQDGEDIGAFMFNPGFEQQPAGIEQPVDDK